MPNAENNFIFERVKAAEIADRKLIRIGLIRINLRSLAVDDLSELSRSRNVMVFSAFGIERITISFLFWGTLGLQRGKALSLRIFPRNRVSSQREFLPSDLWIFERLLPRLFLLLPALLDLALSSAPEKRVPFRYSGLWLRSLQRFLQLV